MRGEIEYKGINLLYDKELNSIEFVVSESTFNDIEYFIHCVTIVTEFAEFSNSHFIIISEINWATDFPQDLYKYIRKTIFNQLKSLGVKNVLLVKSHSARKNIFENTVFPDAFLKTFESVPDAWEWIKSQMSIERKVYFS